MKALAQPNTNQNNKTGQPKANKYILHLTFQKAHRLGRELFPLQAHL